MRVLHLSTSATGGAAIAGQRLHRAMLAAGTDSIFVSRGPAAGIAAEAVLPLTAVDRARSSFITAVDQRLAHAAPSFFSPLSGDFLSRRWLRSLEPDAVVVHNWFNLLGTSRDGMLADLPLPKIFLLHDERLFTGGCHYALECRQFEQACASCPQTHRIARPVVRREHRLMLRRIMDQNFAIVAPSRWLADEARASAAFRHADIHHIPNTIDASIFTPTLRDATRQRWGIAPETLVVCWQPGKGDELLRPVLEELHRADLQREVTLLATGSGGDSSALPFPIRHVGNLKTEADRADFWAAGDVALSLTAFDNFPNIVLEAMACGVPVVIPDIGGAGEAVKQTGGGVSVERSAPALAQGLLALLTSDPLRRAAGESARLGIMSTYAPADVAGRFSGLLSTMLASARMQG